MINNIMQQSARIEDAYAGNLDGLKQRVEKAGVSNELLAAFVLQGQLAKKEAAQRNAAMQQPTNPSTVMEQMQQAADANSGPSEGDVVERTGIAGQQMARNQQNAQIPQGPQGGGGLASQTGQVKLAGGGIVAFDKGGEVTAEELNSMGVTPETFSRMSEANKTQLIQAINDRRAFSIKNLATMLPGTPLAALADLGLSATKLPLNALEELRTSRLGRAFGASKIGEEPNIQSYTEMQDKMIAERAAQPVTREQIEAALSGKAPAGGITGPSAGSSVDDVDIPFDVNAGLALPPSMAPSQPIKPGGGVLAPRTKPGGGVMMTPEMIKEAEAKEAAKAPITPPVAPTGIAAYKADTELRDSAKTELDIDEEKKGLAAIERIRKLSDIEGSKQALIDMEARAEASYKDATPSRTDNLIDLLAAGGGKGGITSVGRRSGELRREENARRRQLDQDVAGIKITSMEIKGKFGADAANAYQKAETDAIRTKQNARNYLATLDKNEREDFRAQMQFSLTSQKYANDLMSDEERNRILRAQLTSGNIEAMQKDVTSRSVAAARLYTDIKTEVRERPEFAGLGTLDPEDDAEAIKALEIKLAAEIAIEANTVIKDMDALRRRQLEIENQRKLFNAENISLGTDADAAIAKAGI